MSVSPVIVCPGLITIHCAGAGASEAGLFVSSAANAMFTASQSAVQTTVKRVIAFTQCRVWRGGDSPQAFFCAQTARPALRRTGGALICLAELTER
jgi:hypothetical protein